MLYLDYTQKLINLQGVKVKKVYNTENSVVIDIEMIKSKHKCPCCSCTTSSIHDYRNQRIKDIPSFGQNVILNYHKRRYVCKSCGKRFSESHPLVVCM